MKTTTILFCFFMISTVLANDVITNKKMPKKRHIYGEVLTPSLGLEHAGYGLGQGAILSNGNSYGASFPSSGAYLGAPGAAGGLGVFDLGHSVHRHITVTNRVGIPVPQPYPVTVHKNVPYPVPVKVAVPVDKPYPVHVAKPYPVPVEKPVPVYIDKPVPVHYSVPVRIPVPIRVAVPYPKPVPVPVIKEIPVAVQDPVVVQRPLPVYLGTRGGFGDSDIGFGGYSGNSYGGGYGYGFSKTW